MNSNSQFLNKKLILLPQVIKTSISFRCSIVVSIPACHAGDPGSIPGSGANNSPGTFFLPVCLSSQMKGTAGDAQGFKLSLTVYLLK
ncbi:unnamed protein product [Sphagnum balticum]